MHLTWIQLKHSQLPVMCGVEGEGVVPRASSLPPIQLQRGIPRSNLLLRDSTLDVPQRPFPAVAVVGIGGRVAKVTDVLSNVEVFVLLNTTRFVHSDRHYGVGGGGGRLNCPNLYYRRNKITLNGRCTQRYKLVKAVPNLLMHY